MNTNNINNNNNNNNGTPTPPTPPPSTITGPYINEEQLKIEICRIEDHLSSYRLHDALQCVEQLVKIHTNNTIILDLYGETLLQLDRASDALNVFERSCALAPDTDHTKWMQVGQLKGGIDGLQAFQHGIDILLSRGGALSDARALSNAYCSMVELYTTDLCDLPNAESECERLVQAAIHADLNNAEAYFALVNLRLIQQRPDEARSAMSDCLKIVHTVDMDSDELSYEFLLNAAKAGIELEDFDNSLSLLNIALHQNDTVGETWYLAALVSFRNGDAELFPHYAEGARRKDVTCDQVYLQELLVMEQALPHMLEESQGVDAMDVVDDEDDDQQNGGAL